ncbi:hypothetical protein PINS_up003018 [Pythium insidiosum]|nr:hypothetical protein PINS_up003018 [Pythium insidiosum]
MPLSEPSPSAASVMKCPDSEKSLVQLLSSLNQEVTPAVRYIAEAKEPRARKTPSAKDSTGSEATLDGSAAITESAAIRGGDATSMRPKQKRKRDAGAKSDDMQSTTSSEPASDKARDRATTKKRDADDENASSSYRRKAPAPLTVDKRPTTKRSNAPSPSPRGRARKTPPPDPKMSAKKKASSPPSAPATQKKRKTEQQSDAMEEHKPVRGRRAQHRASMTRRARAEDAIDSDDEMRSQAEAEGAMLIDDEEGEEEELDSNLDYCEVCLSAGDLVCCDFCPRSFHLSCLKMTEKDLPEGDWQCAECRKPSYFDAFQVTVAEKTTVVSKCLQIIKCLKSHPFAKPFLFPVEDVPDYTSIVKQPMDLSTIEQKLQHHRYLVNGSGTLQGAGNGATKILHLGAFAEDVRLIWHNCKLYNDDGSGIVRAADELAAGFERLYQHVLDFVTATSGKATKSRDDKRPSKVPESPAPASGPAGAVPTQTGSRPRNSIGKTGTEQPSSSAQKALGDGDSVSSTSTETDNDEAQRRSKAAAASSAAVATERASRAAESTVELRKDARDGAVVASDGEKTGGSDVGRGHERVSERAQDNASPMESVV